MNMISPTSHKKTLSGVKFIVRGFTSSRNVAKNNDKNNNKIQLQALGNILSKGKMGQQDSTKRPGKSSVQSANTQNFIEDFVDMHAQELEESSSKIGYMSKNDIKLQEYLDSGRQFGGSGSGSVLRRFAQINSLPEEIDILETPWEEIERIYGILKDLDNDQGIHYKYKKRLAIDTKSLLAVRNKKLTDMCKFARRDQKRQMSALDSAFEGIFQYNVIGFDRSFAGVPLQTGKNAFTGKKTNVQFPVELLEDARPFNTKIPIFKKEVNFMEDDALEETLMPHDVKPNSPEELLSMEGKPIMIANIDDYNSLDHMSQDSLKDKVEYEIFNLQRMLSSELSRKTVSYFSSLKELKKNEYLLVSKSPLASKYTGPTFKYQLKYFDLIPFYATMLTTIKHRTSLTRHLYKVTMLNLHEQIDTLTRIKYKSSADRQAFLDRTHAQVHSLIKDKLLPLILQNRIEVPQDVLAVSHKFMTNSSFSRICWLRKPKRLNPHTRGPSERRQAQYLKVARATDQ